MLHVNQGVRDLLIDIWINKLVVFVIETSKYIPMVIMNTFEKFNVKKGFFLGRKKLWDKKSK